MKVFTDTARLDSTQHLFRVEKVEDKVIIAIDKDLDNHVQIILGRQDIMLILETLIKD